MWIKLWLLDENWDLLYDDYDEKESEFSKQQADKYWVKVRQMDIAKMYLWHNMNDTSEYSITEMLLFMCWVYCVREEVQDQEKNNKKKIELLLINQLIKAMEKQIDWIYSGEVVVGRLKRNKKILIDSYK